MYQTGPMHGASGRAFYRTAVHFQSLLLVLSIGLLPPGPAAGGPIGESVVEGSASFDRSTPRLTLIETPDRNVIIDYQSFDILSGETVRFVQPDAGSRVLNQILTASPTTIDGALLANGQLYIVNPAGVIFGANAVVDVARLFAAAGQMDHTDFLQRVDQFSELSGPVRNAGELHADAIHLIGRMVENSGMISAPDGAVVMAAGETVIIGQPSSGVYIALDASTTTPSSEPGIQNSGTIDVGLEGSLESCGQPDRRRHLLPRVPPDRAWRRSSGGHPHRRRRRRRQGGRDTRRF